MLAVPSPAAAAGLGWTAWRVSPSCRPCTRRGPLDRTTGRGRRPGTRAPMPRWGPWPSACPRRPRVGPSRGRCHRPEGRATPRVSWGWGTVPGVVAAGGAPVAAQRWVERQARGPRRSPRRGGPLRSTPLWCTVVRPWRPRPRGLDA